MELTVNPKDFGLEEKSVTQVAEAFAPKIAEREGLAEIYSEVIKKELSPALSAEAKALRLKLVKVRTGIASIHKTQKEYSLAYGRFVDAWKNKETAPVVQMEEKLEEIELYFENIEKERIAKLQEERAGLLKEYVDMVPDNLGIMESDVWEPYFESKKNAYLERKKELERIEAERMENERLDRLATERRIEVAGYSQFVTESKDLRNMDEKEYSEYLQSLVSAKSDYESKQEEIRKENERLAKEAAEKESQLIAEREAAEKERVRLEEEARKAREEKELAERKAKEAADRIEAERLAKEEADRKAAEKLAKAPIKKQLNVWVDGFSLPDTSVDNETAREIKEKFEAFKKWAKQQVENI